MVGESRAGRGRDGFDELEVVGGRGGRDDRARLVELGFPDHQSNVSAPRSACRAARNRSRCASTHSSAAYCRPSVRLSVQVAPDGDGQDGAERRHEGAPGAARSTAAGRGNATSRRSSTAKRRYTHVLSRVRWPRRSPIVLSDRPDRKRCTAYECRTQWVPWNGMASPLRFDQAWKASVTAVGLRTPTGVRGPERRSYTAGCMPGKEVRDDAEQQRLA